MAKKSGAQAVKERLRGTVAEGKITLHRQGNTAVVAD